MLEGMCETLRVERDQYEALGAVLEALLSRPEQFHMEVIHLEGRPVNRLHLSGSVTLSPRFAAAVRQGRSGEGALDVSR